MERELTSDQELIRALKRLGIAIAICAAGAASLVMCHGCSSAWPQRCETDIRSGVSCRCGPDGLRVVHHTISGTATLHCNGELLPIDVDERGQP